MQSDKVNLKHSDTTVILQYHSSATGGNIVLNISKMHLVPFGTLKRTGRLVSKRQASALCMSEQSSVHSTAVAKDCTNYCGLCVWSECHSSSITCTWSEASSCNLNVGPIPSRVLWPQHNRFCLFLLTRWLKMYEGLEVEEDVIIQIFYSIQFLCYAVEWKV